MGRLAPVAKISVATPMFVLVSLSEQFIILVLPPPRLGCEGGQNLEFLTPPGSEVDPETPLERLGFESCAGCTKNQPRIPHLGTFRDHLLKYKNASKRQVRNGVNRNMLRFGRERIDNNLIEPST